ncbi:uncharacterized protein YkwD [Roseateles asaccharophilus]|uniref:hypothetical protein n=1 Tax=Roseateles asaccharophilus TaxID=582607 RepID=UPI003838FF0F
MKKLLHISALALTATLTACGGGGGGSAAPAPAPAPAPTPAPAPAPAVADAGTLKTSVPTPTYAANSTSADAFATLNTVRLAAGAGLVAQDAKMDVATAAHAKYVTTNLASLVDYHNEDAAKPDFYAATLGDRLTKAGFSASNSTEVIGGTGASLKGGDCVLGLLGTAYHGPALLSRNTSVGVGFGADVAGIPLCVIDLATPTGDSFGQVPAVNTLLAYPSVGQTNVIETFYVSSESPRPPVSIFPNATAGTPVIVSVRNADYVNFAAAGTLNATITAFGLKDAAGNAVPAAILAHKDLKSGTGVTLNSDSVLSDGFVVLIPLAPLAKGQVYTATFSATLKTGGTALAKTWSFTTNP